MIDRPLNAARRVQGWHKAAASLPYADGLSSRTLASRQPSDGLRLSRWVSRWVPFLRYRQRRPANDSLQVHEIHGPGCVAMPRGDAQRATVVFNGLASPFQQKQFLRSTALQSDWDMAARSP